MNNRIKKKPLQLRRSVRTGIRIGVLVLTAMTTVEIARQAWETYQSRTGAPGGEILVLPMMILLFYTGWTARGEWIDFKRAFREAERREYHASDNPAYKG
jgi:hypothetical protein